VFACRSFEGLQCRRKGDRGWPYQLPLANQEEWWMMLNLRVVGEDWQLSRRCLTRCLAVLVERRVVGEMAIFANHHKQNGRNSLPHPLVRFPSDLPDLSVIRP